MPDLRRRTLARIGLLSLAATACGSQPPRSEPPDVAASPRPGPSGRPRVIGDCRGRHHGDPPGTERVVTGCVLARADGTLAASPDALAQLRFAVHDMRAEDDVGAPLRFATVDVDLYDPTAYRGPAVKALGGLIRRGDGALLLVPRDLQSDYDESKLSRFVAPDGRIGFVDLHFTEVLPAQFDWASAFQYGAATVCTGCVGEVDSYGHESVSFERGDWTEISTHLVPLAPWHPSRQRACTATPPAATTAKGTPVARCTVPACDDSDVVRTVEACITEDARGELRVADDVLAQLTFDVHGLTELNDLEVTTPGAFVHPDGVLAWVRHDGRARLVPTFDNGPDVFRAGRTRFVARDGTLGLVDRQLDVVLHNP
jgi:hypothetical protein